MLAPGWCSSPPSVPSVLLSVSSLTATWAAGVSAVSITSSCVPLVLQALQSNLKYSLLPRRLLISKRLAQCLHPALPSGVHLKALETYEIIFKIVGTKWLAKDLFLYRCAASPGPPLSIQGTPVSFTRSVSDKLENSGGGQGHLPEPVLQASLEGCGCALARAPLCAGNASWPSQDRQVSASPAQMPTAAHLELLSGSHSPFSSPQSCGLFPLLAHAAMSVRPVLLGLYEKYFLPLQRLLLPSLQAFVIGLLPGLEEGSEIYDRWVSARQGCRGPRRWHPV